MRCGRGLNPSVLHASATATAVVCSCASGSCGTPRGRSFGLSARTPGERVKGSRPWHQRAATAALQRLPSFVRDLQASIYSLTTVLPWQI